MKYFIYTTLLLFVISTTGFTQTYDLFVSSAPYSNITGTTSVNEGEVWDDPYFEIPIGFDFQYYDEVYNTIYIDLGLGGVLTFDTSNTGIIPLLVAYGADIIDRGSAQNMSQSPISYSLEGDVGSRIFKLEWQNVGFFGDINANGQSIDFVNFQLWLYEGSNDIELRFGPNSVTQPGLAYEGEMGSFVALIPEYDLAMDSILSPALWVTGPAALPSSLYTADTFVTVTGTIPEGTVYRFSEIISSVQSINSELLDLQLRPNPSSGYFQIQVSDDSILEESVVQLLDLQGRAIRAFPITNQLFVGDLPDGLYLVRITHPTGTMIKKLVKE